MHTDTVGAAAVDRDGTPTAPSTGMAGGAAGGVSLISQVGATALTALLVITVAFLLPRLLPGDPISALADPASGVFVTDPELRAVVMASYGLDQPLARQYLDHLGGLARGDLGWSIARNRPVAELVTGHLPWTLLLAGSAVLLGSLLAYVAGIMMAWRRGGRADRLAVGATTVLRAVPEYVLAAVLLLLFAVLLPMFPIGGARTPFSEQGLSWAGLLDVGRHLVLPLTALTLSVAARQFLLLRNTVVGVLGADHLVLARAKGLPDRLLAFRHAGRPALLPFLTLAGIQVAFSIGGAVFVESVFAYPGMGRLILSAVEARDYPVLEAAFVVLSLVVLAVNLLIDVVARRLDPRTTTTASR